MQVWSIPCGQLLLAASAASTVQHSCSMVVVLVLLQSSCGDGGGGVVGGGGGYAVGAAGAESLLAGICLDALGQELGWLLLSVGDVFVWRNLDKRLKDYIYIAGRRPLHVATTTALIHPRNIFLEMQRKLF